MLNMELILQLRRGFGLYGGVRVVLGWFCVWCFIATLGCVFVSLSSGMFDCWVDYACYYLVLLFLLLYYYFGVCLGFFAICCFLIRLGCVTFVVCR